MKQRARTAAPTAVPRWEEDVGRGVSARRHEVHPLDDYRTLTAAEAMRDRYAAQVPLGYDLILEFAPTGFCLTAKGSGLNERECVDLAPEAAESSSVFRRLAAIPES